MRLLSGKAHGSVLRAMALAALACALAAAFATQKKGREEETQTLQLPKDLPGAVIGDTGRLTFHVTPLSSKGLLSQQVRDALKQLNRQAGGGVVLRIRAFVAGSGDLRRVRDLVSEAFDDKRKPLPALSLVQAGALPLTGAQVVLEAIVAGKKEVNPNGLAFFSALPATSENPLGPVPPLTGKTLAALRQELKAAGAQASDVLHVTCYVSSLENLGASRTLVAADYPRTALNFVQTQRSPYRALSACEAVARLKRNPGTPLRLMDADGLPAAQGESQIALVASPRVVLTGAQSSFGYEEKDARLAFERLGNTLEQAGAAPADVAFVHYYPLATRIADQVRKTRLEFFSAHPPAGVFLMFEGLTGMDAGFAVDAIAVRN